MLFSLAAFAGLATGDLGHAATPAALSAPVQAAAIDDAAVISRSLLARRSFEELGLQLIGVANFGGKPSCFIRIPGAATPQSYEQGDKIGEFRVAAIASEQVAFERDGVRFQLALGGDGGPQIGLQPDAAPALDADGDNGDPVQLLQDAIDALNPATVAKDAADAAAIKTAADLKSRTSNYRSAKVIQDAWDSKLSKQPVAPMLASINSSSRASSSDDKVPGDASPHPGGAPDFAYPIKGKMTSEFGYRRYPLGGGSRMHNGLDLAAPAGTTVHAAADGVVEQVGYNSGLGRFVYIRHINGFQTRYGHMSAQLVKEGQTVKQGDPIGREGSTGESTGPHVHFEIRQDGRPLNPLYYLGN